MHVLCHSAIIIWFKQKFCTQCLAHVSNLFSLILTSLIALVYNEINNERIYKNMRHTIDDGYHIYTMYLRSSLSTRNVPKINNRHQDEVRLTNTKFDHRLVPNMLVWDALYVFVMILTVLKEYVLKVKNGDILFLFCILVLFPIKSLTLSFVFALRRPHNYACTLWFASFNVEETCFF